jgi:hypothetical protein
MSATHRPFVYDDFERQLLDTAKFDHAPQDLPMRVGVALGLSVPILVASEIAAVASAAEVGSALAPSGMVATFKGAIGWSTTSLFGTALKGIAIGVLSGSALLGTGHAVAHYVRSEPKRTPVIVATRVPHASLRPQTTRLNRLSTVVSDAPTVNAVPTTGIDLENRGSITETQCDIPAKHPSLHGLSSSVTAHALNASNTPTRSVEPLANPQEPHAQPVIPEKTDAVGRFPSMGDDVSALYDSAKPLPLVKAPVKEIETTPDLSAAELQALRNATLQRTRTLLSQSKASLALAALDQFRHRVGAKYFGVSELLLRIEALAELGRAKEAQADVAIVERLAPASAVLRQAQQLARSRFVR